MPEPTLLVQLSDLHVGGSENGVDPIPRLEAVIEAVRELPNRPDGVVVTGDLTDDGAEESYRIARGLLERLDAPLHVLPGNHDDRARIRAAFDLPGEGEEPVNYSVDLGELRLVLLDSNVPGRDPGSYDIDRLGWLDRELAAQPERPALLAVHHPPLATGIAEWDAINLDRGDREALGEVVARHPQLRAIVGGHLHRIAASTLSGCPVLAAPSTYLQVLPNYRRDEIEWVDPPGFAIHVWAGGELASQVQAVPLSG
ncbi:MAG TPA: phosphodiesterase [Solirubrobacterales bacterium]|jgi:3',5'-cyclic AMP phosphodiesterase CpdA|nr:phosphodiesterase [Solirubrobacterales bacterium]